MRTQLLAQLQTRTKDQLMHIIANCINQLQDDQLDTVFGEFYFSETVANFPDEAFLEAVKEFHRDSIRGVFYDRHWEWTSKTYNQITPPTSRWYCLMGYHLDLVCQGITTRPNTVSKAAFSLLLNS